MCAGTYWIGHCAHARIRLLASVSIITHFFQPALVARTLFWWRWFKLSPDVSHRLRCLQPALLSQGLRGSSYWTSKSNTVLQSALSLSLWFTSTHRPSILLPAASEGSRSAVIPAGKKLMRSQRLLAFLRPFPPYYHFSQRLLAAFQEAAWLSTRSQAYMLNLHTVRVLTL